MGAILAVGPEVARWKREKRSFRVIVCVIVRTAIVSSLSFSLFYFYFYSFSFFFFCVQPSLFASFDSPSRPRPHAKPPLFHPRGSLFSPQVFFIFLPLHFAATGFHGQLISSHSFVSYSLFNSHCTFDLASSPRNRPDYRPHARWPVENCAEFLRVF